MILPPNVAPKALVPGGHSTQVINIAQRWWSISPSFTVGGRAATTCTNASPAPDRLIALAR